MSRSKLYGSRLVAIVVFGGSIAACIFVATCIWMYFSRPAGFSRHQKNATDRLDAVIVVAREVKCESIGVDRIGPFWREGDRWRRQRSTMYVSLDAALADVGLTKADFQLVVKRLDDVGAYRVEVRSDGDRIYCYSTGTVAAGHLEYYFHSKDILQLRRNATYEPLGGGWYFVSETYGRGG